jgi:CheY-like chemotaxis protein
MLNLTGNARDAMPAGGTLTVSTGAVDIAGGRYARLTIRDTGAGMAPHILDRALEPFFTTKTGGQSSGLGLATVYGIVNQLGGTLRIESTPDQGTIVTIDLPTTDQPFQAPVSEPEVARGGTETILLAEDEEPLREAITRSLSKAGYTVLAASGGAAALATAEAHTEPIHLLLSDVMMPGMPGHELATHLHALRPHTPVLFMSGYAGALMNEQGAIPAGITILPKPFTESEILVAVRATIGATSLEPHGALRPLPNLETRLPATAPAAAASPRPAG